MIIFLRNWCEEIIIAVVISIIIESLLPEGNNKKYCKVVIGIYILFTIVSPFLEKVNGNIDLSKYFTKTSVETSNVKIENIKKFYAKSLEESIKNEVEKKFNCKIIELSLTFDEKYENITDVKIKIKDNEIQKVQIGNNDSEENTSKVEEIKKYILENEIIAEE